MSTGYKLLIAFFILAYISELIFLPGLGVLKYFGFLPMGIGVYLAISDKENSNPEGGRFWGGLALMAIGAAIPIAMFVILQDSKL